jgi:non-ribosomal peptide synthetase component E (peptide arylation enzyme)
MDLGIRPWTGFWFSSRTGTNSLFAYFALQKIGAVTVLLIDRYREFEISRLISLTGATSWIVPSKYKKTDYIPIIHEVLKEYPWDEKMSSRSGERDNERSFFTASKNSLKRPN